MTHQTSKRKSFILHKDSLEVLDQLTDDQAGKLFKAIYSYQKTSNFDQFDQFTKVILIPFVSQFKRDDKNWLSVVERNKNNIAKRWQKKDTSGKSGIPKLTKNTDSDSDSKSKNKSENKNEVIKENILSDFEEFWNFYDYKKSKPKAMVAYEKSLKTTSHQEIMEGVRKYKEARGVDSQYWKHPTTWLNAQGWLDEHKPKVAYYQQKPFLTAQQLKEQNNKQILANFINNNGGFDDQT